MQSLEEMERKRQLARAQAEESARKGSLDSDDEGSIHASGRIKCVPDVCAAIFFLCVCEALFSLAPQLHPVPRLARTSSGVEPMRVLCM
jgi:hypothetical protein